jgi:hypothetical protein
MICLTSQIAQSLNQSSQTLRSKQVVQKLYYGATYNILLLFLETSCVTRTHGGISNATKHKLWCYDTPSRTCHRVYDTYRYTGIRNGNTEICEIFRTRQSAYCTYPGRFHGLRASSSEGRSQANNKKESTIARVIELRQHSDEVITFQLFKNTPHHLSWVAKWTIAPTNLPNFHLQLLTSWTSLVLFGKVFRLSSMPCWRKPTQKAVLTLCRGNRTGGGTSSDVWIDLFWK